MSDFEYVEPNSLEEALSFLAKSRDKSKICAGGTDLIVKIRQKSVRPQYIVNIGSVPGLTDICLDAEKGLRIGALATIRSIETSSLLRENGYGLLCQAARQMASVPIRNVATVGGNLCNAAPSADMAPPFLVLSSKAKIVGPEGERVIPLENFFLGPGHTILRSDEILTELQIPNLLPDRPMGTYLKHSLRGSVDLAIVGVAAVLTMEPDVQTCKEAKIALGAVAPTPLRAYKAEDFLRGKSIDNDIIGQACQAASKEARPISDARSSAEYRRKMIEVFTCQALSSLLGHTLNFS